MDEQKCDPTDEAGASASLDQTAQESRLSKGMYEKAKRTLEEHELASPVAIRFMIDQIERLEREIRQLQDYRIKYFDADANLKIEKSRSSLTSYSRNVSSAVLAAGSGGAGIVASFLEVSKISIGLFVIFVSIAGCSFFIRAKDDG